MIALLLVVALGGASALAAPVKCEPVGKGKAAKAGGPIWIESLAGDLLHRVGGRAVGGEDELYLTLKRGPGAVSEGSLVATQRSLSDAPKWKPDRKRTLRYWNEEDGSGAEVVGPGKLKLTFSCGRATE